MKQVTRILKCVNQENHHKRSNLYEQWNSKYDLKEFFKTIKEIMPQLPKNVFVVLMKLLKQFIEIHKAHEV